MRSVNPHLLEDKMDEAVTHYINSHQQNEPVHVVDTSGLSLNVQEDAGSRVVTVMHQQNFPPQLIRNIPVGEPLPNDAAPWGEDLLDAEGRLAALVAHLAQNSRSSHHPAYPKIASIRSEVDSSVMIDGPLRLFNGQTLEQQSDQQIVVSVPSLPPLPPLPDLKKCSTNDWFNKTKVTLKEQQSILTDDERVLEVAGSPAQHKQNKKSLPHKKRISRKLRRTAGSMTPQQDNIVLIECSDAAPQEEILPDNFVTAHHTMPEEHIAHEMRPIFICQICGEFYGDEQFKFYHHLKQHYEPHTIIIENPVPDLGIDKMTNTCIVDNVSALPDSLVELSLDTLPKTTMYQPLKEHILYSSSDKTLSYTGNKVLYSMANVDKEHVIQDVQEKTDNIYESLDKVELYNCPRCNKSFRKYKHCEAHIKEVHSKTDDMNEFSEPEDLMEGIHVSVGEEPAAAPAPAAPPDHYDAFLPHLTVDNGHVHQEHVRHWYARGGAAEPGACAADGAYCPACPAPAPPAPPAPPPPAPAPPAHHLKEEVLQRIFEVETAQNAPYSDNLVQENAEGRTEVHEDSNKVMEYEEDLEGGKKKRKKFECSECGRVFNHRNSLMYHVLAHKGKRPHVCGECGKGFYTAGALKIHSRVHNDSRPHKCEQCDRTFRQWGDLKYHISSLHSSQKHYKCDYCGKEFARKYSLSLHRRIHTGERNYKCELCNKSFRASSYRLLHMRIHTGEKPHKCSECGKCFRVGGDLRRHTLVHAKNADRKGRAEPAPAAAPPAPPARPARPPRRAPRRRRAASPSASPSASPASPSASPDAEGGFLERLTALYNIPAV